MVKGPLRMAMLCAAWLSCGLGLVGIFVPVLPTTPLLLLAAFLFSRSSQKWHAWITGTKAYRSYVVPFKEAGGLSRKTKVRMLLVSYAVLGVSAVLVQKAFVWAILAAVAAFLFYLVVVRIPTVGPANANGALDGSTSEHLRLQED